MRSAPPENGAEPPYQIPTNHPHPNFHSTVSLRKLRRFNYLILIFRIAAFSSSLASFVFMLATSRSDDPSSPRWYHFDAFRLMVGANAIVTMYSLFEMVASVWEIARGATLFSEVLQVWFDFGHDQVFAYLLLSADSAGTALARVLKGMDTCTAWRAFCIETDISIALGFVGFFFLGFSCVLSGFRVACFVIKGCRFHL